MEIYFSKKDFKSIRSVKNYIGKMYGTHTNFLVSNGFNVEKCVFCDRYADTVVEIKDYGENWCVDSFTYYRGNKVCRDKNCKCSTLNPQSKEWLMMVKGLSEDDVNDILSHKCKKSAKTQKEQGRWDPINNVFSKEYWISRGYSDEDVQDILKQKSQKSIDTLKNKGWFDDKSNNPFSKEYWIKKGLSDCEASRKVNSRIYNRPEFWEERGYTKEDSQKLSRNSAKRDLKHFIEKYGDDEGRMMYDRMRDKISRYYTIDEIVKREKCSIDDAQKIRESWILSTHTKNTKYSKTSMLYFENILSDINLPDEIFKRTYYAENEFGHYDKQLKRYYFYDFVIEPLKICIEYNGIIWHPKSPNQEWIQPNTHKSAKEVYDTDLRKKELLENEGYTYFVVWDDDIDNNRVHIINVIQDKISEYERSKFIKIQ